ncbi:DUF5719 family protein [Leucobacter sp. USHLN153]|uniref:DUF5719 family protein n=1 Tax=Leucobacter sp. USHLN153 TaxID=3081268 RepID=UPI0030199648
MIERARFLRGGARAVTGLVVIAAGAAALLLVSTLELPSVEREPVAVTVDTTQQTTRSLVCAGAFAELGADTARPGVAIPGGEPAVSTAGDPSGTAALARTEGNGGLPAVITAPESEPLAAAQTQSLDTVNLRGAAASSCTEPLNEQWLIGGGSSLGVATTLSLGNPGTVPATVSVTVFDESGEVDAVQTAGVLVAPGTQQSVSLNGYAPDRERLAVRVVSTGAPVVAHLGVAQSSGIDPFGISGVTSQREPQTEVVIPGIANARGDDQGPSDSGEGDAFPMLVRALAPGDEEGNVSVRAIDDDGRATDLGTLTLVPRAVGELSVTEIPRGTNALVLDADVPVIATAMGSAGDEENHDFEWFAPAPQLAAKDRVAVPVASGGRLVLANSGDSGADVELQRADGKGKATRVSVKPGATRVITVSSPSILTSSQPVSAAVRMFSGSTIAGFPIVAPDPRDASLTVYTR